MSKRNFLILALFFLTLGFVGQGKPDGGKISPFPTIKSEKYKLEKSRKVVVRGRFCGITIHNRTPYSADLFIDKEYRGRLTPFGKVTAPVGNPRSLVKVISPLPRKRSAVWEATVDCEQNGAVEFTVQLPLDFK
jgi:hypothetical protein